MANLCLLIRVVTFSLVCASLQLSYGQSLTLQEHPLYSSRQVDHNYSRYRYCQLIPSGQDGYDVIIETRGRQVVSFPLTNIARNRLPKSTKFEEKEQRDYQTIYLGNSRVLLVEENGYEVAVYKGDSVKRSRPIELNPDPDLSLFIKGYLRVNGKPVALLHLTKSREYEGYWLGAMTDSGFKLTKISFDQTALRSLFIVEDFILIRYGDRESTTSQIAVLRVAESENGLAIKQLRKFDASQFAPPKLRIVDLTIDKNGKRIGLLGELEGQVTGGVLRVVREDDGFETFSEIEFSEGNELASLCFSEGSEKAAVFLHRNRSPDEVKRNEFPVFDEIHVVNLNDESRTTVYSHDRGLYDVTSSQIVWPKGIDEPFAAWGVWIPID